MAHYEVTHQCGHVVRISLTGPHRNREWRLKQMEQDVCRDCWETAQRTAAAERAAKEQWPAWTAGTERQRGWAESLRARMLDKLTEAAAEYQRQAPTVDNAATLATLAAAGRARLIEERTDAAWWIKHQHESGSTLLRTVLLLGIEVHPELDPRPRSEQRQPEAPTPPAPAPASAPPFAPPPPPTAPPPSSPALILRPEQPPLTETIATLRYQAETQRLTAILPEMHETFRQTMRGLDYTWDRAAVCWIRVLPSTAGDPLDRLAELAHTLVAAGFVVRLHDAEAYTRAVAGTYQPEQRRWVRAMVKGAYVGWLSLSWPRSDDLYAAANRLRGARFRDGCMLVPAGSADEIEEFARVYDVAISPKARAILDEIHESQAHGTVLAAPKSRTRAKRRRVSGDGAVPASVVPLALPVPEQVEIAEELADETADAELAHVADD